MARFTVTLRADRQRCPLLLSNGNPVGQGEAADGRHWARWEDPFKKPATCSPWSPPSWTCCDDTFTTASGRTVQLAIYVEPGKLDQCGHAMAALKKTMRWDEQRFGLEMDLDHYMIVAVGDFNMGAMENKGLNIFNTKYVLARPIRRPTSTTRTSTASSPTSISTTGRATASPAATGSSSP